MQNAPQLLPAKIHLPPKMYPRRRASLPTNQKRKPKSRSLPQKSCFLVTRSLKIENERQKGPSKRPPEPDLSGGNAPNTNSVAGAAVLGTGQNQSPLGTSLQAEGAPGTRAGDVGQFILGDEKIEVTMRVEFVYFLETASPSL